MASFKVDLPDLSCAKCLQNTFNIPVMSSSSAPHGETSVAHTPL